MRHKGGSCLFDEHFSPIITISGLSMILWKSLFFENFSRDNSYKVDSYKEKVCKCPLWAHILTTLVGNFTLCLHSMRSLDNGHSEKHRKICFGVAQISKFGTGWEGETLMLSI